MRELTPREAALEAAFARHAASVTALAARITGDPSAAADVCQEAFVRYFDRMDDVRGDPGPWLRAVAGRLALDHLRRAKRDALTRSLLARSGAVAEPPSEEASRLERGERIRRAVASLPSRQREVVLLRLVAEDSFPGIAATLGVSEGSAKAHFRRAIEALRRALRALA